MFVDGFLKRANWFCLWSVIGLVATLLGAALAGWWVNVWGVIYHYCICVAQAFGVACYALFVLANGKSINKWYCGKFMPLTRLSIL